MVGYMRAYYKSFNRLVSELGPNSMNKESLIHYFIAGLNANAVRNTNLNLHMHTFFYNKPNSTVTDLYAEADKVISLSGTNSGIIGLGKRAGPDRGEPRPQQKDRGYTGYSQRPNPQHPQQTPKKRSDLHTSGKDVVCSKCHNKGHLAVNCRSTWTRDGKFIGEDKPPSGDYWTQRHAADLKAKKAAMVKTPPQRAPPQQQQQQPAQRQKRKKTAAITLADPAAVQAITLADPSAATVLEALSRSEISEFSDASENFAVVPVVVPEVVVPDERTVGPRTKKLSSKVTAWDLDSEELDLDKWTLARNKRSQKFEEPETYASRLKGSASGLSAKPLEQLRFAKRNNTVRR
jgi:hypothetical protein